MNKIKKIAYLSATFMVLSSSLLADGYQLELSKPINSNAGENYYPDLVLPMSWNQNFNSSLEFRIGEQKDNFVENGSNAGTLSIDEKIKHSRLKLNLLNYKINKMYSSYSFGIGASYDTFKKNQVGDSDNYENFNGTYTNNIDIEVLAYYLKLETILKDNSFDVKIYALMMPISNLKVTQNTELVGNINNTLTDSSSQEQDFNYELDLNFISKSQTFVDLGFNANYRFLPLSYDLNGDNIAYDETTIKLKASLFFNFEILDGWMPTIAYSTETISTTTNAGVENIDDRTEDKIYLGFNTRF